jgi:hypothetical protein
MLVICLKSGCWRHWNQYYSTTLYVVLGNMIYNIISYQKPLWNLGNIVGQYFLLELFVMTLLYSSTVILYLTYYPIQGYKQIAYILCWVGLYVIVELFSLKWCGFTYLNGWNILYTIGFDITMFALIRLHYKKPILAWVSSAVIALVFIWWFKIPLSR